MLELNNRPITTLLTNHRKPMIGLLLISSILSRF